MVKMLTKIKDIGGDRVKIFKSTDYHYLFNLNTGFFARWGKATNEDPEYSKFGPEILDIEISTICSNECSFCYKSNTQEGTNKITIEIEDNRNMCLLPSQIFEEDLIFYSSYDWLMPVVEKIMLICEKQLICHQFRIGISSINIKIEYSNRKFMEVNGYYIEHSNKIETFYSYMLCSHNLFQLIVV